MFIRDPDPDFLPFPDPGARGQKGTGSRIRIRNTACLKLVFRVPDHIRDEKDHMPVYDDEDKQVRKKN